MTFSLKTKTINFSENEPINNAVILLHGYGGDGNDISMLTLNWKRFLKNTIFLCPNAHEKCSVNSSGYQWFDLTKDDPEYILNESLKAEIILKKFVEEVKNKYKIQNSRICLVGFSQGCMMSINLGLTSPDSFNCIIGFSGKIINKENLSTRIISKCKILLLHGDKDTIVPPTNLLDAKDFFIRKKIDIDARIIKNCDHHISVEASSLALNFIKNNLNI